MYRRIDKTKLLSNILMFMFYTSYFIYFVYGLTKLTSLENNYIKLFIFYTSLYGINIIRRSYNLFFIIKNYNKSILLIKYNRNTKDYFSIFCNIIIFILECIILSHFYPGFAKCSYYNFNNELCNCLRIIVYSFEISLTVIIIIILLIIFVILLSLCNSTIDRRIILKLLDFIDFPKEILRKINIIKFHPFDKICTICLDEQSNLSNEWSMLSCGHKFHIECIDCWKIDCKNCPICNTEITVTNQNLLSVQL
jgi:hypothetical protein